jgi:dTDP-4-amino-4,6-dideoxygalactose transaminase
MNVPFYRHSVNDDDIAAVAAAMREPMLTTGDRVHAFEERFAEYTHNEHAVGVMSGTHALELALHLNGVGPGDEVITTPLTFVATTNAIVHSGATPVFVDVEESTGNIDATLVEAAVTPRTRAILIVHLYGVLCDMRRLRELADRHGVALIEDSAHCVEGLRDGVRPGNLGDVGCFSFYATKNITCGEGGMLTAHDEQQASRLASLALHGMTKSAETRMEGKYAHWDVAEPGYKANMPNILAAMLENQLARIESQWAVRDGICERYERAFADTEGVAFPVVPAAGRSARHLFTIWVDPSQRDAVILALNARGVGVTVNYRAVHLLRYYREALGFERGMFPLAERIGDSTITLPLYPGLTDGELDYVIESVREAVATAG